METRLEKFEHMLSDINKEYIAISKQVDELKLGGKTKTTTFKQLLTRKMQYKNMLIMYESYDLMK